MQGLTIAQPDPTRRHLLQMLPALKRRADSGAPLRSAQIAHHLGKDMTVTRLGFGHGDTPADDFIPVGHERQFTIGNLVRGFVGQTAVSLLNYTSAEMFRTLAGLLNQNRFDAIQLESVHLLPYLDLLRSVRPLPLIVADWHYIDSEFMARFADHTANIAKRLYARRTSVLLSRAEKRLAVGCSMHLVVCEREQRIVESLLSNTAVHVIPNGVDCSEYSRPSILAAQHIPDSASRIVFVGSMDYRANADAVVSFCHEIWPTITQELPDLIFTIVGRNPGSAVQRLRRFRNVEVTGSVDDVHDYYQNALAAVVPLRFGSGTRIKILEAMAASVPVISSSLGAEGLSATPGVHFIQADTPREFCSAILEVSRNAMLRQRLAREGHCLVEREYDWSVIGARLRSLYEQALESRNSFR